MEALTLELSEAAAALGVSIPKVKSLLREGVIEEIQHSGRKRLVTLWSVLMALKIPEAEASRIVRVRLGGDSPAPAPAAPNANVRSPIGGIGCSRARPGYDAIAAFRRTLSREDRPARRAAHFPPAKKPKRPLTR